MCDVARDGGTSNEMRVSYLGFLTRPQNRTPVIFTVTGDNGRFFFFGALMTSPVDHEKIMFAEALVAGCIADGPDGKYCVHCYAESLCTETVEDIAHRLNCICVIAYMFLQNSPGYPVKDTTA